NRQHAVLLPRPVVFHAVEAVVYVARRPPEVSYLLAPHPGLVRAPLADAQDHRASGCVEGVAHRQVSALCLQALRVAPVVLQIIDAPTGVRLRVLKLSAAAARSAAAGLPARVRVDAELQALR